MADARCVICVEKFADAPDLAVGLSKCGHVFHQKCILRWQAHSHVSRDKSESCAECGEILTPSDYQKIYLNFAGNEPLSVQKFKKQTAKLRSVLKQLEELEGQFDNQVRERSKENGERESNEKYLNDIKTVLSQCQSRRVRPKNLDNCKPGNAGSTSQISQQPGQPEVAITIQTTLAAFARHLTQTTIAIFNFMYENSSDLMII